MRFTASVISYLLHPLFIPLYVGCFLMFVHPGYFVGYNTQQKVMLLIRIAYVMVFFPVVTVLLLKAIGFIESVMLHTQKDRIIPYIACGIYFFWAYLVFRNQPSIPGVLTAFTFAVFLSSSAALLANIYFKISMHAIGVGGLFGFFLLMLFNDTSFGITLPFMTVVFISGLVLTARLIVSDHIARDVYYGFLLGMVCQLAGALFISI